MSYSDEWLKSVNAARQPRPVKPVPVASTTWKPWAEMTAKERRKALSEREGRNSEKGTAIIIIHPPHTRPAMNFSATIEYVSSTRALVALFDASGEWAGAGRIDVRAGGRANLYEAGYKDACARAVIKGGRLDRFTEAT